MRLPDPQRTVSFLRSQWHGRGGFVSRAGKSDLYYTMFAVQALAAMDAMEPFREGLGAYLQSFGRGQELDLVHLSCLVRCMAEIGAPMSADWRREVWGRMQLFRCSDSGYHQLVGQPHGNVYGAFLVLGAVQDLAAGPDGRGMELSPPLDTSALLASLRAHTLPGGAFVNDLELPAPTTQATSAAAVLLEQLGDAVPPGSCSWLMKRWMAADPAAEAEPGSEAEPASAARPTSAAAVGAAPAGGFAAFEFSPIPDLLSTACAVLALAQQGAVPPQIVEPCTRYVLSLRDAKGGFRGSEQDERPDCEYALYALVALGSVNDQ